MTEFKYAVTSTNIDGNNSTARFLTAASAYRWAARLKEESTPSIITKKVNDKQVTLTLSELKKEAGSCLTSSKKTGRGSRKR